MFTGIIKDIGSIKSIQRKGSNLDLVIESQISKYLKVDESVSHNGVCLTIVKRSNTSHTVNIIQESLNKTSFGSSKKGDKVNLERSLTLNDLLSGHLVQGHIDSTGIIQSITNLGGSIEIIIKIKKKFLSLIIPQGSICIHGISLTIVEIKSNLLKVCIIPYTYKHTNIHSLKERDSVNIEFDILGKYIQRSLNLKK